MVLASQMGRPGKRRSVSGGGGRSTGWMWATSAVVVAIVVGGYVFYTSERGQSSSAPADEASAPVVEQAPSEPQPRVVRFGMNRGEAAVVTNSSAAPALQPVVPAAAPSLPQSQVVSVPALAQPAAVPTPAQPAAPLSPTAPRAAASPLDPGMRMIEVGSLLEGRRLLSEQLVGNPTLTPAELQSARDAITSINRKLVFSPEVIPGDTLSSYYTIESGDRLTRIAFKNKVTHQFLEVINGIDPNRINAGQRIKVFNGPFHAVVDKSDYRMDIYANDSTGRKIYIRSFIVGLGEADSTPVGSWLVAPNRKVQNPGWANPRTGEVFAKDDPKNPIGEYWLALQGTDERTKAFSGYGIHGTIDPASVGHQASMGCVRLLDADIELVYKMLVDGLSTVVIQP